jgi:hypothetical protein
VDLPPTTEQCLHVLIPQFVVSNFWMSNPKTEAFVDLPPTTARVSGPLQFIMACHTLTVRALLVKLHSLVLELCCNC